MRTSIWMGAALLLTACTADTDGTTGADGMSHADQVAAGRDFSQRWCTGCHVVGPDTAGGTVGPSFMEIAAKPGETGQTLSRWMVDPHPPMPDLDVTPEDADAVAAYILSLKE